MRRTTRRAGQTRVPTAALALRGPETPCFRFSAEWHHRRRSEISDILAAVAYRCDRTLFRAVVIPSSAQRASKRVREFTRNAAKILRV